ncbi:MAG: MBL fold metallo-hydrolase [Ruminococcaceae bacterium]|nr:MBL fold metallo-hydrolase [Oscillospiraceae bacterium]
MTEKIAENIYRLQIPLEGNPLRSLNSFLIKGNPSLLIDTGFRTDACRNAITAQLVELGVNLDDTDIFLTHLHSDHTGLAVDLHREGRKIFVSEEDGTRMIAYGKDSTWAKTDDFFRKNGFPQDILEKLRTKNPARANAPQPFEELDFIEDGQVFEYGGYKLQAIMTPGHTPGHMCLYIPELELLFMGDHILYDITPNITSWSGFEDSLGRYLESLERIKKLPVNTALPGHRELDGNMCSRADEIKAHHMRRLDEAENAVKGAPGCTAYYVASQMSWDIHAKGWDDFPISQRWFAVGEAIAHLDHLVVQGRIKSENQNDVIRYYSFLN